jgi:predicted dinucleotide-binding enzyme
MKVPIVGAGNMGRGVGTRAVAGGHEVEIVDRVLMAGDDDDAKRKVAQLVSEGGVRPPDVGPLRRARELEQFGFLHIATQEPLNPGFGSTIKLNS